MKRLLTFAAMFLCCTATMFAQFSGSGSGTESDPYLIFNPVQLNQIRNFLGTTGIPYFKLMADINLTEFLENEDPTLGWQPIGTPSQRSSCTLDGNGKTISGLWINRPNNDYVGLFGYGGTVMNLTIKDAIVVGKNRVGIISGEGGTVKNCVVSGDVKGNENVGGCSGRGGAFSNTISYANVTGTTYTGGLSGYVYGGNILNSIVSAVIKGGDYTGGICGYNKPTSSKNITGCGFFGSIVGKSYVGGICGQEMNVDVNKCFVAADVHSSGDNVGGIIGSCDNSRITDCYSSGTIIGNIEVGGIVGKVEFSGTDHTSYITSCYTTSYISGYDNVGGLCGSVIGRLTELKTCISNASFINAMSDNDNVKVGRIYGGGSSYNIGEMGTNYENKACNKTVIIKSGVAQDNIIDNIQNGTSISKSSLKLKATYVALGWDFTNIWEIQETECYPYFKTQTAPPVITSDVVSGGTSINGQCVSGSTVTLDIDGVKQQKVSTGNQFSFTISPLQAGHAVHVSAKEDGKDPSYYATETVAYLGKGTETDPYQVYTASDLTGVYRKGYFKLMNDIDLTDYINQFSPTEGWVSIGREGCETIHFDGNGHKITGLWCNSTRDNTGLFSCFANGTIKDLTVETASGKQVKGGANTGILIGKIMNGTIKNCNVKGSVSDGTPVGGMVGLFDGGTISQCQAAITINTTGGTSYIGGLVGETTGGTIDQCVTTGTLTANGTESYVGGLVGKNNATITNCYSTADITSSYNAAGIVAYNYGVVDKCFYTGDLYSNNYAAGIIGYNDGENSIVRNSVATSNKIEVTYESQQVEQGGGYGQRIIGGLKNNAPTPEMNNYALKTMQVSANGIPQIVYDDIMNGTAKTDTELKQKATYQTLNWDFDNIWKIDEGIGYPYQTIKVESGTEPSNPDNPNPDDPNNPNDPEPQTTVEVTDISTLSNAAYIEPMEEKCGSQATISIKMKNTAAIRGFQFDLYLPEGVTVVKSSKGKIQGSLSAGRLPDEDEHTLTFSEQADGAIRFLCSSQYDETFTGNDGEIATLKVNIADDMEDGEYPIQLKNMKLTETNISNFYETALVQTKLTISSFVIGDINGDGVVDVSDYTGVANHIHGNTPDGFNAKAADVDISGTIDVSDYTGIANIIHTGSIYGNNNASARMLSPRKANTDLSTYDNVMYISPFTASAGTQTTLSIKMKNTAEIRGFQFDLYLPEGMTVVKSSKGRIQGALSAGRLPDEDEHELTFSEQADGAIRFLCSSQYDETFTGNDGEIATLQVNIANNMANGNYAILLKDMKLTETDISKFYTADLIETTVTIGEVDTRIILDETSTTAPEAASNVDVRVLRTIKADEWSTICLPFAMSTAQVKEAFSDDVKIANFTGYEATTDGDDNVTGIKVNFAEVDAIEANHPYVIKVSSAISEFTVDNVDIDPEDEPKVATVVRTKKRWSEMIGTYVANTTIENQMLFLNGNKFWYSNGSTKMKGYRAYFDFYDVLSEVENASAKITFFDGTTEISNVNINDNVNEEAPRYNLAGQKVSKSYKGIVIQNGVKRIVK